MTHTQPLNFLMGNEETTYGKSATKSANARPVEGVDHISLGGRSGPGVDRNLLVISIGREDQQCWASRGRRERAQIATIKALKIGGESSSVSWEERNFRFGRNVVRKFFFLGYE